MTAAETHSLISSGETAQAIETLQEEARRLRQVDIADKLEVLMQDYRLMLSYFSSGGKDAERATILAKMRQRAHDLTDDIRMAAIRQGAEASIRERNLAMHTNEDIHALMADDSPLLTIALMRQRLTDEEARGVAEAIANGDVRQEALQTGALALNLISRHNRHIALAIIQLASANGVSAQVVGRAVTGLVGDMLAHAERWTEDRLLTSALEIAMERKPELAGVIRHTVWAFLQTKLTDEISNYLREDMGSEISRIAKKIADNVKDNTQRTITPDDLREIFGPDSEKVIDKFDRLARWQKSGADVAFSTYKLLKDTSFFRKEENWIRPFDRESPEVKAMTAKGGFAQIMADTLAESRAFCDSDKFSMMLAVDMVPEEELTKLNSHFLQETRVMSEMMESDFQMTGEPLHMAIYARFFVHDLYRMLNAGHSGDADLRKAMEGGVAHLLSTPMGKLAFATPEDIDALGRRAVDNELWGEATKIYAMLADKEMATDANWQRKYALCLMQTGQDTKALATLRRADLMDDTNSWTKTKLAEAFYKSGDLRAALYHLEAAAELKKPSRRLSLMRADCLRKTGRAEEAILILAKMNYEAPDDEQVTRMLAETYAATGKKEEATRHFAAIPQESRTAQDLNQMAILHLASGDNKMAIQLLRQASAQEPHRHSPQDEEALTALGVDPLELRLAREAASIMAD